MALADERPCRLNVLAPFDQRGWSPQGLLEDERPEADFRVGTCRRSGQRQTRGQRQTLGFALADERPEAESRPEADFRAGTCRREALQIKCPGPL